MPSVGASPAGLQPGLSPASVGLALIRAAGGVRGGVEYLADADPTQSKWDTYRALAETAERHYAASDDPRHWRYVERVHDCARVLVYQWDHHPDGDRLRLRDARFCRLRLCPLCMWRRSLSWYARAFEALPRIRRDHPTSRFLLVTLTTKNVPITELRVELDRITRAFARLTTFVRWKRAARGWIRSLEVERSPRGEANVHAHVLVMVPSRYFKSDQYISKAEWSSLWRRAARLDYDPIVDVRRVRPRAKDRKRCPDDPLRAAFAETLKYETKPLDLVADGAWFRELDQQTRNVRRVTIGGQFRTGAYFKADPESQAELIAGDDTDPPTDPSSTSPWWWRYDPSKAKYARGGD